MKTLFIDNWCFCKQPLGSSFADAKTLPFALIEMPHDWLIHDVKNLYEDSVGWYKKYFVLTETDLQGSRYSLRFDGVYMDSTVYINGTQAFEWKYGYTTFEFEITPLLTAGTNEILVRVNHQSPNTRWYSGAGIFRNVWLNKTGLSRFVPDGIQVLIDKAEDNKWNVTVNSEVDGGGTVRYTLIDPNGAPVAEFTDEITIDNPEIWDTDSPNLYTLRSDLLLDGILQDSVTQRIGFRELAWDVNTGFSINGRHLKLQGVCQHHDMGALGAAVNKQAIRRQFDIMRSMGVNAVRTSHNPPAPELMEVADETGMLILSEAFDMWERPKTECDYGRFFPEWHERDVASWVRRDRNCPSLIMWSIGNEIYDTHADKRGQEVTVMLRDCVLKDDKSHLISIGSNYMGGENAQKCADILKVAGYNYGEKLYIEHHAKYPDWIMYGSEVGSTVSSRGIYHFPLEETILADDDGQCSSLGNSTTAWGAKGLEVCIKDDQNTPFSCGHFIWTGFDYIGEPTPYTTKNSYFGTVDTCGYPKDAYYVYRSQWTDYKTDPMVHIYPYWDFNDGQPIDIRAVSNAPTVEVFVNGESKGKFSQDDHNFIFNVKAKYVPGEIRAVAYDENGVIIAEDVQKSFGDAVKLQITASKTNLFACGKDLTFIDITVVDKEGNFVANANNRVNITVEGAARLIGTDNGDSTDYEQYKTDSRRLFSGRLLAIAAANYDTGSAVVTVTSPGLEPASLTLNVLPPQDETQVIRQTLEGVVPSTADRNEIPVRNIKIDMSAFPLVKATLQPEGSSCKKLTWRATNISGVDSPLADLAVSEDGLSAEILPKGDGDLYLRCLADNGGEGIVISQTFYKLSGYGKATLNPYEFISACLYDQTVCKLGSGMERGVATTDDYCAFAYENVDFGEYGSDTIIMPVYRIDDWPLHIEIWEGMPKAEGSELIADHEYRLLNRWQVYNTVTVKLNKRLSGVTSLGFAVNGRKIHIKGFEFEKQSKVFDCMKAVDADKIYGDSFRKTADAIERIGNNVTVSFLGLEFPKAATKVTICGKAPIDNTIHLMFRDKEESLEFKASSEYCEQRFDVAVEAGKTDLHVVFLPGSNIDFKWIRFEA